jgi:RNA polymerase sigma-70 factor (ECF subfamily)
MNALTDHQLLQSLALEEPGAFRALWDLHHERVYRLAYGVLLQEDQARDIVQEVFLEVLAVAPRWRPEARLSTWLHRVTLNKALSWRRGLLRFWSTSAPEPRQSGADEELDAARADRRMRSALARLSPRERAVLALSWDQDLSPAEIAETLDIAPGAARVALHRARKRLKEWL